MEAITVELVAAEAPERAFRVTLPRSTTLKGLLELAERALQSEVYNLYVRDAKLTDMSQLADGDTVVAVNGLSPITPRRFFLPGEEDARSEDNGRGVRVVVLGQRGAGKTSLVLRFVHGFFKTDDSNTLIESEYEKEVQLRGQHVALSILDTAGEVDPDRLSRSWISDHHAYVLALGTDQLHSWAVVAQYHRTLSRYVRRPRVFLVVTKVDLLERLDKARQAEGKAKLAQVEAFCKDQHIPLFKTSAKTNKKIHEMFMAVCGRCADVDDPHTLVPDEPLKMPFLFRALSRASLALARCLRTTP